MTLLNPYLWPESEWQVLSARLAQLPPAQQRRLAQRLAERVLATVLPDDPRGRQLGAQTTDEQTLAAIEAALDEDAWRARDGDDEPEYVRLFRQARAASTAIAARLEPPSEALARALYEARHALDDDALLRALVAQLGAA